VRGGQLVVQGQPDHFTDPQARPQHPGKPGPVARRGAHRPQAFDLLVAQVAGHGGEARFLAQNAASTTAEYYLPSAVQALIDERRARVRVLGGGGPWAGLTYPGDRPRLVELVASLTRAGTYPSDLWA